MQFPGLSPFTRSHFVPGGGGFVYTSTGFDGSTNYLNRGSSLTGLNDGMQGLLSFWVKMGIGTDDSNQIFMSNPGGQFGFQAYRDSSDNRIHIIGSNASFDFVLNLTSSTNSVMVSSGWVSVIASWDLSTAGRRYALINGSDQTNAITFTTGENIKYTYGSEWNVCSDSSQTAYPKCLLSEVYFTTEWLDAASALAAFRATGHPKNLGANGSTPTGTQPLLYLHNPYSSFQTNLGSGGGLTVHGTLGNGGTDIP